MNTVGREDGPLRTVCSLQVSREAADQGKYVGQTFSYTALSLSEKTQKMTFSS